MLMEPQRWLVLLRNLNWSLFSSYIPFSCSISLYECPFIGHEAHFCLLPFLSFLLPVTHRLPFPFFLFLELGSQFPVVGVSINYNHDLHLCWSLELSLRPQDELISDWTKFYQPASQSANRKSASGLTGEVSLAGPRRPKWAQLWRNLSGSLVKSSERTIRMRKLLMIFISRSSFKLLLSFWEVKFWVYQVESSKLN